MRIIVQSDKESSFGYGLWNPSYTDDRFYREQTVFLAAGYQTSPRYGSEVVAEATYNYSDRLREWDYEKSEKAWNEANGKGLAERSPALLEAYLQSFFDDPDLQLVHVLVGVNRSNGFSYQVYGYISKGSDTKNETQEK